MELTDRPCSPGAEKMLGQRIKVLDHGYIELVDYLGNDQTVEEAARVCTATECKDTRKMIRYLLSGPIKHWSPFEQIQVSLRIKMPIFAARQWFRHRTHRANEVSGRYTELVIENYTPSENDERLLGQAGKIGFAYDCDQVAEESDDAYRFHISQGIPRELARINLPLSTYTTFRWNQDLHNLLHLTRLRVDSHAQWEIQEYGRALDTIIATAWPLVHEAWVEFVRDAVTFSKTEMQALRARLDLGADMASELRESGFSEREIKDFLWKVGL